MTIDEHVKRLGQLVVNFQSLELILRMFLQKQPTARSYGVPNGVDIYSCPVGAELPENELTSFDSLGKLIDRFNNVMMQQGLLGLDSTIVEIRDVLAHGRVSASSPNDHLRLLKFDKPRDGKVRVIFNAEMTENWFKLHTNNVYEAIQYVTKQIHCNESGD